ncbi:MAG: hypothetical protein A2W91_10595 [Bacteroidetes bacterium GWF2_38_335]|nr:MAG: hypothetical protein A2W91_10595 [Bacteroidetes bacterium GWF2_38_335]OFY81848.1 MAG: hypothetical protein A2281_06445 [Bacteroidetes bacterium RIFOXYA12_FULL_38_20]HBS87924.1 hypothetical protein [Bacteroidales bacterium]
MHKSIVFFVVLFSLIACSETKKEEQKINVNGGDFTLTLPEYMKKSENISSEGKAEYMYKNENSYLFCVVYKDSKKDYKTGFKLADYYTYIANDILNNYLDYGTLKPEKEIKINGKNALQFELNGILMHSPGDQNSFFIVTVVESENAFYEIRTWCDYQSKSKFQLDMIEIAKSFKTN